MGEVCELCGGDGFEDLVVAYDRMVARREDYRYRRCLACGLVSLERGPERLGDAYPNDYPPHARRPPVPVVRPAAGPTRRRSARLVQPRGGRRMLDVGCGSGHLLARHRDLGWNVMGIEPNRRAAEACRQQGLDVQAVDLFQATLPAAHFDVIWLHHVIEHVRRPVEALERVRFALARGGVVVVVTPNVKSLGFRLYGSCWYAIDAPRHLRLFDARTLAALARRAGLEAAKIRSQASARVLAMSRHYHRTQGPVLPPGLAARAAILERSREEDPGTGHFRRLVRPLCWAASRVGRGESLRAELVDAGDAA
jgi:SAM-dependent methyltransferase